MLLIAESMPATSEFIPLIGIYFTLVMSLTSLSVLLAVVLLNVHLYGSALKPVPRRLRRILFFHVAPCLRVKLHRSTTIKVLILASSSSNDVYVLYMASTHKKINFKV